MKSRFLLPLVICCAMTTGLIGAVWVQAAPTSPVQQSEDGVYQELLRMDQSAAALYTAAYTGNRAAVYAELQKLGKVIDHANVRLYGSDEGWKELEADIARLNEQFQGASGSDGWLEPAVRIRLAADALLWDKQGLWRQYEELLLNDLAELKQAWLGGSENSLMAAQARLIVMNAHARRMETAAKMAGDSIRTNELMFRLDYIATLFEAQSGDESRSNRRSEIEKAFEGIHSALAGIYQTSVDAATSPVITPPAISGGTRWALFLGAVISAVLTWIGWRKYKQTPYGIKSLK
ncbi:sporulation protein YpjB [Paenibacillus sp. HB172176]|uniref:sporulation protein YpjB n=1 Tax=Paenibacillus sp. HB172176 TaxID=2493690 RepID=UPI00143AC984|nr:sporulation protein YpjB [Paenibacillus sp. HB172176]